MPYANNSNNEWEKLQIVWEQVRENFGSIDDVMDAFGLTNMPQAQKYGILFGCLVFFITISTVFALLVFGGTFTRIQQQAESPGSTTTILTATQARKQRPLLYEELLESSKRMLQENYSADDSKTTSTTTTKLTKMILNDPPPASDTSIMDDEDENKNQNNTKSSKNTKKQDENGKTDNKNNNIPHATNNVYEENYKFAYRKCQDKPGGTMLSGRPEARFEAYARGFAGCGNYTQMAYRRSYGRMYEAICCVSHENDDKYNKLFQTRPFDLVGKYIRLEGLDIDSHLENVFNVTCGKPILETSAYDPLEVWGFCEDGPFTTTNELQNSFVFQRRTNNEAGFAIVHSVTDQVLGIVLVKNDDPQNLKIQLEPPILHPSKTDGSKEQLESCYLIIDKLFALGYRRIQLSLDTQDGEKRKLVQRLGFTFEGVLYKDMVVKESNRDSNIYGLLNSDWKKGARAALFGKLCGKMALRADRTNERNEDEYDERERGLKEKEAAEAKAKAATTKNKNV